MEQRDVALIVLYNKEKKVLAQHREDDRKVSPGKWAFFGGGIENGETPLEAVAREAWEELRFKPKKPRLVLEQEYTGEKRYGKKFVFVEECLDSVNLELLEGQDWGWFNKQELMKLDLIDHDIPLWKQIFDLIYKK